MSEQAEPAAEPISVLDYRPKAMVRVRATKVERARFPVVDAHNHLRQDPDPAEALAAMDACNVAVYVDLSGGSGDTLKRKIERLKGRHSDRFAVFHVPNLRAVGEPGFAHRAVQEMEVAKAAGAQGIKVFKSLGLTLHDPDGKLVPVDDRRLYPVWEAAGSLGLPVLIHIADPFAFFEPIDATNERYLELFRHPDWHFLGKDYPPLRAILEQRDHLLADHPKTVFIGAHIGSESEDLDRTSMVLDRYPNYYVDISARQAELGRQPRRAREFFVKHADRILFGTDVGPSVEAYRSYARWMETYDECFEYYGWPGQGLWQIYGLGLPDDVLRKVYYANAARLIPGVKVG